MIRLFINVYDDSDPARDAELKECLRRNRACTQIDEIVELVGRPTFDQFFARIAAIATADDISVVVNSDIYCDETISLALSMEANESYILSRWDVGENGESVLFDRKDSQDAWIIKGKPKRIVAPFTPGVRGCDNSLAAILVAAGYRVSNPGRSIKTHHLHLTGLRRYSNAVWDMIPKPYLLIEPHALGVPPTLNWSIGQPGENIRPRKWNT